MPRRLTTEQFIEKAIEIHDDKYNYRKVEYINNSTKVKIYCNTCKYYFYQTPNDHLGGSGCRGCYNKIRGSKTRKTREQTIEEFNEIWGEGTYGYDRFVYKDIYTPSLIYCYKCNKYFKKTPTKHKQKQGCQTCSLESTKNKQRKTREQFIKESIEIHGDKYNYDEVEYENNNTKVKIYCNTCNEYFNQAPNSHLSGQGCKVCSDKQSGLRRRTTREDFIERSIEIHGDKYNYDKVEYVNNNTKVKIYCNTCNEYFLQTPSSHLGGSGCDSCADYGYSANKPSQLYYFEILKDINEKLVSYYKIGITNNTLDSRYNNCDKQKIGKRRTWDFADGRNPRKIEKHFLDKYKFCPYDYKENGNILESGNTEIFLVDILPDIEKMINQNYIQKNDKFVEVDRNE